MPVRDEEHSIGSLLEHLLGQTLAPDEIVITDGGSIDETRSIIRQFIERGAPVRLLTDPDSLPGRARNICVANARNDWLAFIDAGITPGHNWLRALADQVVDPAHADVVYGSYEPIIDSFFTECAAIAYVPPPADTDAGPVRPYSIASALMPRVAWEKAGGFPENLRSAEDLIFMQKVEAAGFRIVRAPAAIVRWAIQPNLWGTFKRFVIYSRENVRAGLFRRWQAAIFSRYGIILALVLVAAFAGGRFVFLPLGLWLLFMILRAGKALRRNRISYPAGLGRNLARMVLLVPIIATIDAAAFVGSIDWFLRDKLHLYGSRKGHVAGR